MKKIKTSASAAIAAFSLAFCMMAFCVMACFSSQANAAAELMVGKHTVVTKINDQQISNSLFGKPKRSFSLPAGKHTISAKYKRLYELTADDHDVLRSVDLTVTAHLQDGQSYQLVMANQPQDYAEAKTYAKKPTLVLMKDGKPLVSETAIVGTSGGLLGGVGKSLGGVFTYGEQPTNVTAPSSTSTVQADTTAASVALSPVKHTAAQTHLANTPSTLDRFMQLWLQATPEEREKIKNWVSDK